MRATSSILIEEPSSGGIVLFARDGNRATAIRARPAHLALHDPLTGLANRALLEDRLTQSLERLDRHPGMVALLFIDLDTSSICERLSWSPAGDDVLQLTADRLRGPCAAWTPSPAAAVTSSWCCADSTARRRCERSGTLVAELQVLAERVCRWCEAG